MDSETLVRTYYQALDEQEYQQLMEVLCPEFVHERPDRTISGRKSFIKFMRDNRPDTDTTHRITSLFINSDGHVAAQGTLMRNDNTIWFRFVDVFMIEAENIHSLITYTDKHPSQ